MDDHVDSYKEDFDIDKRIIRRAAESQNPEDKTLMWFCPPARNVTASTKIRSSFRERGITIPSVSMRSRPTTSALPVSLSRKLSSAARCSGCLEINYREQAANVAQNSVAPDHDRLTFADGFVLERPCRSSFDAAMARG